MQAGMKKLVPGLLLIVLVVTGIAMVRAEYPAPLVNAEVLPLALTDDFEFRKFEIFKNAVAIPGATPIPTRDLMIDFERKHRLWGAINSLDVFNKTGQYFTFFWRAKRSGRVTLRLEYRQASLKNYVQGRELYYPEAKGGHTSEFAVLGSDYESGGPITSWRAILIEDRKIVGLLQSRTWR